MYKKSMHLFVEHYEMEEVMQEETLMRAFQRWRKLVRENKNSYCMQYLLITKFLQIIR